MREKRRLELELIWNSGAFLLTEKFLPNISHNNIFIIANVITSSTFIKLCQIKKRSVVTQLSADL